ncbi:MAG: GTP cyclohydrolase 1 [Hyphomicrobiaceae bacterium hypho_1]
MLRKKPVINSNSNDAKPTRKEAEAAVRTLIRWAGEDPEREGLVQTPARVVESYKEFFRGYHENPYSWLENADVHIPNGYDDIIMLHGIRIQSFCEHHIIPFEGVAAVAYLPNLRFVGLSRLAKVTDTLARRLQTQEGLTQQIADTINTALNPRGVAVLIEAEHQCVSFRGLRQSGIKTITNRFLGEFADDTELRKRFLHYARTP